MQLPVWRKSSYSSDQGGACVETRLVDNHLNVRDSKDPDGSILAFTGAAWSAFTAGIRAGEFD